MFSFKASSSCCCDRENHRLRISQCSTCSTSAESRLDWRGGSGSDSPSNSSSRLRCNLHHHGGKALTGFHPELMHGGGGNVQHIAGSDRILGPAFDGLAPNFIGTAWFPVDHF